MYLYDLDRRSFYPVEMEGDFPHERFFHSLFRIDNKILAFGGIGKDTGEETKAISLNSLYLLHLEEIFDILPVETLLGIIHHLEPADLINLGATCAYLYHVCGSDNIWEKFNFDYPHLPTQYGIRTAYCEDQNLKLQVKRTTNERLERERIEREEREERMKAMRQRTGAMGSVCLASEKNVDRNTCETLMNCISDQYDGLTKIMTMGDGGVGKSSLVHRFIQNEFNVDYWDYFMEETHRKMITLPNGDVVMYEILDQFGQDEFQVLTDQYMRDSRVFLLHYSITNRNSFDILQTLLDRICLIKDVGGYMDDLNQKYCGPFAVIIVGTKADLEEDREIQHRYVEEWCRSQGLCHIETSARENIGVEDLFEYLIPGELGRRYLQTEPIIQEPKTTCSTM